MTRIADLLAKGRTWSFEFFPPKTPEGQVAFDQAVTDLSALEPAFVSITYGAGGSARDTTYDLVVRVNEEQGFPAMPHLTCVGHTRAELARFKTGGGVVTVPLFVNGRVIVGSRDYLLYGFNAADGSVATGGCSCVGMRASLGGRLDEAATWVPIGDRELRTRA